ncbi:MAG TPA: hypothetical protein VHY08_01370, partial [Bacillota bacterium]|nr:hypothetical protein [Bacillota bacterium]
MKKDFFTKLRLFITQNKGVKIIILLHTLIFVWMLLSFIMPIVPANYIHKNIISISILTLDNILAIIGLWLMKKWGLLLSAIYFLYKAIRSFVNLVSIISTMIKVMVITKNQMFMSILVQTFAGIAISDYLFIILCPIMLFLVIFYQRNLWEKNDF